MTLTQGLDTDVKFEERLEGDWLEKWNTYIKPFYRSKCLRPTLSEKIINKSCQLLIKLYPYIDNGLIPPVICMGGNRTILMYWNNGQHNLDCKITNDDVVEFKYRNKFLNKSSNVKIILTEPFNDSIIQLFNFFVKI